MPLAVFRVVEDTARETLRQGLHGWAVPDCTVAMWHSGCLGKHGLGYQRFNKSISRAVWCRPGREPTTTRSTARSTCSGSPGARA